MQNTVQTKDFWTAAGMRALRTWAQTLLVLGGGEVFNLLDMGILAVFTASVGAAFMSVLNSIVVSIPEAPQGVSNE